jgi:hypothetical protein
VILHGENDDRNQKGNGKKCFNHELKIRKEGLAP